MWCSLLQQGLDPTASKALQHKTISAIEAENDAMRVRSGQRMFVTTKQHLPSTSGRMTISDKSDVELQQLQSNMVALVSQRAKEKAAVEAEQLAVRVFVVVC